MDKLYEAFITAHKKKALWNVEIDGNTIYLITERLMNIMCYLLWYQVLDSIFCCFLGSDTLVDVKKSCRWAMCVKCSTFDCTFSVTTGSRIADCTFPKQIFWGTFSLLFSNWDSSPQPAARALIPIRMNALQYKQRINQRQSFPDSPQVCLLRLGWTVNRQTLHWSLQSQWQSWFPAK